MKIIFVVLSITLAVNAFPGSFTGLLTSKLGDIKSKAESTLNTVENALHITNEEPVKVLPAEQIEPLSELLNSQVNDINLDGEFAGNNAVRSDFEVVGSSNTPVGDISSESAFITPAGNELDLPSLDQSEGREQVSALLNSQVGDIQSEAESTFNTPAGNELDLPSIDQPEQMEQVSDLLNSQEGSELLNPKIESSKSEAESAINNGELALPSIDQPEQQMEQVSDLLNSQEVSDLLNSKIESIKSEAESAIKNEELALPSNNQPEQMEEASSLLSSQEVSDLLNYKIDNIKSEAGSTFNNDESVFPSISQPELIEQASGLLNSQEVSDLLNSKIESIKSEAESTFNTPAGNELDLPSIDEPEQIEQASGLLNSQEVSDLLNSKIESIKSEAESTFNNDETAIPSIDQPEQMEQASGLLNSKGDDIKSEAESIASNTQTNNELDLANVDQREQIEQEVSDLPNSQPGEASPPLSNPAQNVVDLANAYQPVGDLIQGAKNVTQGNLGGLVDRNNAIVQTHVNLAKDVATGQFGALLSKLVDRFLTVFGIKAAMNVAANGAGDRLREQSLQMTSAANVPTAAIQERVEGGLGKAGEFVQNGRQQFAGRFGLFGKRE